MAAGVTSITGRHCGGRPDGGGTVGRPRPGGKRAGVGSSPEEDLSAIWGIVDAVGGGGNFEALAISDWKSARVRLRLEEDVEVVDSPEIFSPF
jgi:hypothetical protein